VHPRDYSLFYYSLFLLVYSVLTTLFFTTLLFTTLQGDLVHPREHVGDIPLRIMRVNFNRFRVAVGAATCQCHQKSLRQGLRVVKSRVVKELE